MLYIPLLARNPFKARFYEFFCCLLNFYVMTILVISYKRDILSLHGYCVLLTLDLIAFLFDLFRNSLLQIAREWLAAIMGRGAPGRPRGIPDWWAWCVPRNEDMIKEVVGIDMKLLFFALSGMLAQHLSPLPGRPQVGEQPKDDILLPHFDHLMCLLFIVSSRLICLSAVVIGVNIVMQVKNLLV